MENVDAVSEGGSLESSPQPEVNAQIPVNLIKRKRPSGSLISYLNKFLVFGMAIGLAYMILGYKFPYKSKVHIPKHISKSGMLGESKNSLGVLPPLSDYIGTISHRQIFKIYEPPRPKIQAPKKAKPSIQQVLSGYTFVGIIFGNPSQAIIEEKRSGQSYYLSAGQYLGDIKIEKVEKGKVTVSYNGKTMDVRI